MQLTRAADYALRVMIHMASLPPGTVVRLRTLAAEVDVPESFLAKVLQKLTRGSLTVSRRGPDGGFELPSRSREATILDVVNLIDGPIRLNACLGENSVCQRKESCPEHPIWAEAQIAMLNVLNRDSISELAQKAKEKGSQPVITSENVSHSSPTWN